MKDYPSNGGSVIVAPYNTSIATAVADFGQDGANMTREFLTSGWQSRIRQDGNINQLKFWIGDTSNIAELYITTWRYNGATYDRVSITANIIGLLSLNDTNTLKSLNIPAIYGDYIGYRVVFSTPADIFDARTGAGLYHETKSLNGVAGDTGFDWNSQTAHAQVIVPIEVYMEAPQIVMIGDSLTAGHKGNETFLEYTGDFNETFAYPYQLANLLGWSHQNMGIGSKTSVQIEARFDQDVIALNPRFAVLNSGTNDLAVGLTKTEFIDANKSMFDKCAMAGIKLLVVGILPWSLATDQQMHDRDIWLDELVNLIRQYDNIGYIDTSEYIGINRATGPASNLWDQNLSYRDPDRTHWNATGYKVIANVLLWGLEEMEDVYINRGRYSEGIIYNEEFKNGAFIRKNNGFIKNIDDKFPIINNGIQISTPEKQGVFIKDLIGKLASQKTGTITVKSHLNSGTGAKHLPFSLSVNKAAVLSEFWIVYDMTAGNNNLLIGFYVDGSARWLIETDVDSALDWVDKEIKITVVQDGVSPVVFVDDIKISQTFTTSTDKTVWFHDVISANTPADVASVGFLRRNGTDYFNFDGSVNLIEISKYTRDIYELQDETAGTTFSKIAENKFMMNLPLKSTFNDGTNEVTENVGTHGGNALWGNGQGLFEPDLRAPHGAYFDGVNKQLRIVDTDGDFAFDGSKDFSIILKIKNNTGGGALIDGRNAFNFGWIILLSGGRPNFFLSSPALGSNAVSEKVVSDNSYNHVVCTYRALDRIRRIYIQGEKVTLVGGEAPYAPNFGADGADVIMGTNFGFAQDYKGEQITPRVADFELTQTQIRELYARDIKSLNSPN